MAVNEAFEVSETSKAWPQRRDCNAGVLSDAEAAAWMNQIAPGWCAKFLGMDAKRVRRWRKVAR